MMRKLLLAMTIVVVVLVAEALLVRAEAEKLREIVPPKPEPVMRIEATFCRSMAQIREIAKLTLVGNSPEEALMRVNVGFRTEICERGSWPVWRPTLRSLYSTPNHLVAIYTVRTMFGGRALVRYMFQATPRLTV